MKAIWPILRRTEQQAAAWLLRLCVWAVTCLGLLGFAESARAGCGEYGFSWEDSRLPRVIEAYARLAHAPDAKERQWLHGEMTMPIRLPCTSPECRGSMPIPPSPGPVWSSHSDGVLAILQDIEPQLPSPNARHGIEHPRVCVSSISSRLERPPRSAC